jgi:Flp pilus assembly secretin CpaC
MSAKKILAAMVLASLSQAALAEPFRVSVDQTVPIRLTAAAHSVVVGNASVADVAVADPMTLLVTGKSFGSTNLVVLDREGRSIYTSAIAVAASGDANELTIIAGGKTQTFSCIDKCRPTLRVTDDPQRFGEVQQTVQAMDSAASR